MFERILVALDGSPLAEQILPQVEALASKFKSHVTILRATTPVGTIIAGSTTGVDPIAPGVIDPTPVVEAEREDTSDYLRDVTARLRGYGLTVRYEQVAGSAADVIVERAAAIEADLIAMTTLGRGGLERLVFGGTADHVIRHASCPVLVLRVSDEEDAST